MKNLCLAAGLALAACLIVASSASAESLTTFDLTPLWNQAISVAAVGLGTLAAWIGHRFVSTYAGDKVEGLWIQATDEAIAYAKKQAELYAESHSSIDLHNYLLKQGVSYFALVWP